jgi:hypothetical protein
LRRAYKFRVYLTRGQVGRAGECLRDHPVLTNAALEERRVAWKRCATSVCYGAQSAQLKAIRDECPEQARWSFSSQQATLRRLDRASAGRLSRQGPPVLRWALYEAAKNASRVSSPDHAYYQQTRERLGAKRATISVARKLARRAFHILTNLGDQALAEAA